jgi:hypothetical protein
VLNVLDGFKVYLGFSPDLCLMIDTVKRYICLILDLVVMPNDPQLTPQSHPLKVRQCLLPILILFLFPTNHITQPWSVILCKAVKQR